ncbi:MAG: PAS domain S-box protein [Thermodesulfobacteriota bacterium]
MERNAAFGPMIDSSPLPIVAYDTAGVVTHWNPAAEKTFGWTPAEAVGKRLPIVPAECQAEFERLLKQTAAGEAYLERLLDRRRADGSPIRVCSSAAPLRGADGTVYGVVEILREMPGRKSEEETSSRLTTAMRQAGDGIVVTDARGAILFVNAAFERRSGYREAELLGKHWEAIGRSETWRGRLDGRKKDGTPLEEEAVVSPVRDPSGRIVSWIGIQREALPGRKAAGPPARDERPDPSDGRRRIFRPGPVDVNGVLAGMDRMLRRLAGDAVEFSIGPGRGAGKVMATEGKLEQMLAALVVHARGIACPGGRIALGTSGLELPSSGSASHPGIPPGGYVLLSLEAQGNGTPPGSCAFPDAAGGIVKEFGGHFRAASAERGASWFVYLSKADPTTDRRDAGDRKGPEGLVPGNETILLVEDEDVVRLPAREILRTCGYTVIEARNGKEALVLSGAHQGRIHLVVTDVVMPKMDGLELANKLQSGRPDSRILFMSGYTDSEIGRIDNPNTGIAFLQKPFTAEALTLKVREILDAP